MPRPPSAKPAPAIRMPHGPPLRRYRPAFAPWAWAAVVLVAAGCGREDLGRVAAEAGLDTLPPAPRVEPLVGMNYTHHRFDGCPVEGPGILATLHEPGAEARVAAQLGAMREEGLGSLRLIVWHMRDVPRQDWGVVPSRGGRLSRPYRENLVRFLQLVDRAGFRRLTVSFSPQWENSPLLDRFRPDRLEENWRFLEDVRGLALAHGPEQVRFDLLNEGAPSEYLPEARRDRLAGYVGELWRRWVEAYGPEDATVSVIAPQTPRDRGRRLENLLDGMEAAGALPTWFELHLNYTAPEVGWGLRYADSVLSARGLAQPVTVGETAYEDDAVADTLAAFLATGERPLTEILPWYRRAGAECVLAPPYSADAYLPLAR